MINTYKAPRKINFIVKKVWDDKNNKYGLRPSSIEVEIYGVETAEATSATSETIIVSEPSPKIEPTPELDLTMSTHGSEVLPIML